VVYIIDIDQTCANPAKRFAKAGSMPDRKNKAAFQQWLDHAHNPELLHLDEPVIPVLKVVQGLVKQKDVTLYYLTGRAEDQREETEKWLWLHHFPEAPVLMRENNDWRGPHRYKSEHIKKLFEAHEGEMFAALDDDYAGDCEPMYRNREILFLKVVNV